MQATAKPAIHAATTSDMPSCQLPGCCPQTSIPDGTSTQVSTPVSLVVQYRGDAIVAAEAYAAARTGLAGALTSRMSSTLRTYMKAYGAPAFVVPLVAFVERLAKHGV